MSVSQPAVPTAMVSDFSDLLRGRQIYAAEHNVQQALVGCLCAATLTTVLFYGAWGGTILTWYLGVFLFCAVRYPVARRAVRNGPVSSPASGTRKLVLWGIVSASVLTSFPIWVTMRAEGFTFAYMLALTLGTFWSSSFIHAPVLRSAIAFMLTQFAIGVASAFLAGMTWERACLVMLFGFGTGAALHMIRQSSALFDRSVAQQLDLEQKAEVIGLLLREHETQSSDWLWQTDAALGIVNPSPRFADALGREASLLEGVSLAEVLGEAGSEENRTVLAALSEDLSAGRSFRDVFVPCRVGDDARWFCVSGRPVQGRDSVVLGYRGVMTDATAAKVAEARVIHLANHDGLTNLPNRAQLGSALERALMLGQTFAVLSIDLDGFKSVNDRFGHPVGDLVLIEAARRLSLTADAADVVARFGGDEFVIQSRRSEPSAIDELCRRVIESVSQPYRVHDVEAVIGASIGVAFAPGDGTSADLLLKSADAALYRAKVGGRGTFRFFAPEMDVQLQARRGLIQDLRTALARNEFVLHYQPFVDSITGVITGCEALLRWRHPIRGLVSPVEFIPLAEETGLIVPIGAWVIGEACREAASWPGARRVSLNISPVQFRDRDLPERILTELLRSGLPPGQLEVEVTETVLVDDSEAALDILRRIRALGVRVALDDFGTGYSSLSYLRLFRFDKIKIDRSFVRDLDQRQDSQVLVRAIRDIAVGLGMSITAEGVETKHQAEFLQGLGCQELQGFLFSRPEPARTIHDLFEEGFRDRNAENSHGSQLAALCQ